MKRNLFVLAVLTLTVLFLVSSAVPTSALDGKNYPGAMGLTTYNSTSVRRDTTRGYIFNPSSTTELTVVLPVIKDTIGSSINHGWVKGVDQHDSINIDCKLWSRYMSGTGWYYYTNSNSDYSTGYGNHVQTLNFEGVSANSGCHYFYRCTIPRSQYGRQSYIVSYHVDENT